MTSNSASALEYVYINTEEPNHFPGAVSEILLEEHKLSPIGWNCNEESPFVQTGKERTKSRGFFGFF